MSLSSHIDQLRSKHSTLDAQIKQEERRPGRDPLRITAMKRQKLRLKQEISRAAEER